MAQPEGVVRFIREASSACADAPDADLVERFAVSRDEQAFRSLVARYGPIVWAVCRKLLRNHHDAEDAFQATFLVFARRARDLRAGAAVGGWLHAVAHRVAVRVRLIRRAELTEAEPTTGSTSALDEMTVREAESALHEELARLPEKYRAPLVLCCLEGLSRDEAAHRLAWSANQVKHGLERGRELLRARLARRGIALGLPLLVNLLATPAGAVPAPLVEASIRYATGTVPPVALSSLANGVNRTMWLSKWKWAVASCATVVLVFGAAVGAVSRPAPNSPATPALVLVPGAGAKVRFEEPKKGPPKPAWDVASEYLQLIIDGKPEQALKLGNKLSDRYPREIQTAGLKRVKLAMILVNDSRVMVVTERSKLKRRPNAEATNEHVTVTLERKDADSPWLVRENDVTDEKRVLREVGDYLEGKFNDKPDPMKAGEKPRDTGAREPRPVWAVAGEFLQFALAEKDADALKLVVPGTVSEQKIRSLRPGVTVPRPVAVLINDTRIEVVFPHTAPPPPRASAPDEFKGFLFLMLTKKGDVPWLVKDIDARFGAEQINSRLELYLGGRYDEKSEKQ